MIGAKHGFDCDEPQARKTEGEMAYLYCHTDGCGWEQDDFWVDGYNEQA